MQSQCEECGGPLGSAGLRGRAWPHRLVANYCCYGCLSLGEHARQQGSGSHEASNLGSLGFRLGIALVIAGQSTIFGLALNLHDDVPSSVRSLVQWLIFGSTLFVFALLGGPLLRTAWGETRRVRLTIEALFLLTMIGALAASLQAQLTGRGKIYFEVVSILLVVYTLGKLVGARSRSKVLAASRAWSGHLETCRRIEANEALMVPVSAIAPGDCIEVFAGETIPVDGVIREGVGFVSEAPVSGEPFAVVRKPGDSVLAGTASFDATFRIEATSRGKHRHIDRILAVVDRAREAPLSLQSHADRLAGWFVPLVIVVAVGTFVYWTSFTAHGWEVGLFNAMAVLLVSCPCAIGLATPIAVWSALGRLAERGLIVHSADVVERLAAVDCVYLDKTGTLTDDEHRLSEVETMDAVAPRAIVLGWLSLVEAQSNHPLARPFAELPRDAVIGTRVEGVRTIPGCGIEGTIVQPDGKRRDLRIGRPDWVSPGSRESEDHGGRQVNASANGVLIARGFVVERVRSSSPEALEQLQTLGLRAEILTGDRSEPTALSGEVPVRRGLLPEAKCSLVRESGAKTLMVGDGINDASALAAAHVGIAMASGTDLAVEAADATLYGGDLRVVPWAIAVSRDAVRTVRFNLARAVFYNLAGMGLAAAGLLHPIAAVLLMMLSSLSLIASSARVRNPAMHCLKPSPSRGVLVRAVVHFAALAVQPLMLMALVEAAQAAGIAWPLAIGFGLFALIATAIWIRWASIPHGLDMGFGMLTLGNLGMLLGWWMDNGFGPLREAGCRECLEAIVRGTTAPGMGIGMLLFGNVAMFALGRRSLPLGRHAAAMLTGGNLGMILGMIGGGWCAAQWEWASVLAAVLGSFAGMTIGMIGGMLLGTRLVEIAIERAGWLRLRREMRRAVGVAHGSTGSVDQ